MNQLNLKNLTGKVIKQGDFESPFRFQLLDYQQKPVTKHDGLEATVRIGKGNEIVYQTTATVQKGIVEFEFENAIPIGIYRVEIVVSESVYPSDHSVWLTVESSMVEYQPQEVYRVIELTKEELSKMVMGDISTYDDTEIKRRLTELESNRQTFDISPINERLETLESKSDKDTIYDDTALTERVEALENRQTETYDDTELINRVQELENRPDNDTVYNDAELRSQLTTTRAQMEQLRVELISNQASIVSAGRPDVIDTLPLSKREEVNRAPVGTQFISSDGAGVGAWQWQKKADKWEVTVGDTGWRNIDTQMFGNLSHASNYYPSEKASIRRINNNVYFTLPPTRMSSNFNGTNAFPSVLGFTKSPAGRKVFGLLAHNSTEIIAQLYFHERGIHLQSFKAGDINGGHGDYLTSDPWPTTLPGTPF